jgi:type I restriction enzyme S subunit
MTVTLETIPLRNVVELVMGQAPSSKDCNFDGRGTPFVKVGEFGETRPMVREWTTDPLRMAQRSDVLLCVVGATCGKINLGADCAIGRSVAAIRPHPSKLDQFYLYYFMMTLVERLRAGSVGAAQTVISKEMVQSVEIPSVSLAEQQRIVGILDEAFEGIATAKANAEKNLQNARALFESHLQSVFTQRGDGWVEATLGDVFTTATGTTPPKNNAEFYGDFMPLVKPPELRDEAFDSAIDGLSEAGAEVARTLPAKSVLVSCIGNLGKIGLNTVPVAFNQQINAIIPDESQAIPEFMFFQSLSPCFKSQLEALASGTTVPIVNKSKFNSLSVVMPPLTIQKPVVAQLSSLREETQRLATIYERKLAALDELKKSLLQQAFTGEL